jgi:urease beta subunit
MNSVTEGTAVTVRDSGDCPLRATSRYHRLRVNVTGNFSTLSGVDVEARPEGKR